MQVFGDYAKYYNLLYADKAYGAEVDFILQCLQNVHCTPRNLLDLGCGTGRHAFEMAKRGINITGVDMSEAMLQMGQNFLAHRDPNTHNVQFVHGDARSVRLNKKFDAVTSLFHVMSYQNTQQDALAHFRTAHEHLENNGFFLFDFWYGPGVLTDPPTIRERVLEDEKTHILRTATPVERINENIIEVHYQVQLKDKESGTESYLQECHNMRYWFLPELIHLAKSIGFDFVDFGTWMQVEMPKRDTWNAWMLVQKK